MGANSIKCTPISLLLLAFLLPTSCLKEPTENIPGPSNSGPPQYKQCIRFCVHQLQYCMEQRGCGRVFGKHMPEECKWAYKMCCETCDKHFLL